MLMAVGFVPGIENATVATFDRATSDNAFACWWWAGSTLFVALAGFSWWALVPAAVAIHAAICWRSSKRHAQTLRQASQLHTTIRETSSDCGLIQDQLAA